MAAIETHASSPLPLRTDDLAHPTRGPEVTAAKTRTKQPRRTGGRRQEKSTHIEDRTITLPNGTQRTISLFAQGGAVGIGVITDTGKRVFTELPRVRTRRNTDKNAYRWYNDYRLPDDLGGGTINIRLHGNTEDSRRRFIPRTSARSRPPIPTSKLLYRRRNDAESINRALDDTLWLRRAHSIGHQRQHLNLLTHAVAVNALALHRYRQRISDPPLPIAA